jgi:hypothetical protein
MADSTDRPLPTQPRYQTRPAIPETCPSGEEPPEAGPNASGPRNQWSHEAPTITPHQQRLHFADPRRTKPP